MDLSDIVQIIMLTHSNSHVHTFLITDGINQSNNIPPYQKGPVILPKESYKTSSFLLMLFWQQYNQITSQFNLCINSDPIYTSQQSFLLAAGLLIAGLQLFPPRSSRTSGIWLSSRFHLARGRHFQFCSTLAEVNLTEETHFLQRHIQTFVYTA